jgi:hypothetical protein
MTVVSEVEIRIALDSQRIALHVSRMQQRGADEVCGVSCAKLSHRLGAMAFEPVG